VFAGREADSSPASGTEIPLIRGIFLIRACMLCTVASNLVANLIEGPGDRMQALEQPARSGMASSLHCTPVLGGERLDRVGPTDNAADFYVIVQEGDELLPRVLPQPDDRRILLASAP
jgi:hypothetical protein